MAEGTVSEAMLKIRASTDRLRGDLRRGEGMLRNSLRGMQSLTRTLAPVLSIAGVGLGVHALTGKLQQLIDQGDRLGKLSTQLSSSAEDLDKLRQVAELSGSDLETAGRGLFQLATAIEAAERSSTGRAAEAFRALNIDLKEFRQLSPIQQLEAFAKAIAGIEDPTRRAEAAAAVLGNRVAKELIPTLNSVANDGLKNVVAVMDDDFTNAAQRFNDNMDKVGEGFNRLLIEWLEPTLSGWNELLTRMGGFGEKATRIQQLTFEIVEAVNKEADARAKLNNVLGIQSRARDKDNDAIKATVASARAALKVREDITNRLMEERKKLSSPPKTTSKTPPVSGAGGAGTGTSAAQKDLQRRLEGLKQLEQEFLDAESVRTFEAQRPVKVGPEIDQSTSDLLLDVDEKLGLSPFKDLTPDVDAALGRSKELDEVWGDIGARIGDASLNLVDGLVKGTLDWRDTLRLVLSEVSNVVRALAQALGNTGTGTQGTNTGSILSTAVSHAGKAVDFVAALFHEGGVVGQPGPRRLVDPMTFIGAKRYHSGGLIGSDEEAGILKKGEVVFTAGQAKALGQGMDHGSTAREGNVSVQINGDIIPRGRWTTPDEVVKISRNTVLSDLNGTDGPIRRGVKKLR